jgi:release factor glutamine methyltransferase
LATGRHVLDRCTGSGVLAIAAAQLGAACVTAIDISPRGVRCSLGNADAAGSDVRLGSPARAVASGPYDVVTSNPP